MAKLTKAQGEALQALVDYQQKADSELVFALKSTNAQSYDYADQIVHPWSDDTKVVATVPEEYIALWEQAGFVVKGQRKALIGLGDIATFILCQEALDYAPDAG